MPPSSAEPAHAAGVASSERPPRLGDAVSAAEGGKAGVVSPARLAPCSATLDVPAGVARPQRLAGVVRPQRLAGVPSPHLLAGARALRAPDGAPATSCSGASWYRCCTSMNLVAASERAGSAAGAGSACCLKFRSRGVATRRPLASCVARDVHATLCGRGVHD